ncbi:MAG: hypothetical protein E7812_13465 [Phenylobacterium sp.]|nr:MAG: hypothetical protein E7812_13465 [Phenylobacterium sp.]
MLLSLALAGAALTLLGGGVIWSMDETRRIRRALKRVLGETPHALLVARGRGRGAGCNFSANLMAVAWDSGAWCLVYRLEELIGAELVVDGRVEGRVHRGEERRAVDRMSGGDAQVRLRLIFTDPRYPDFNLDLWLPQDAERKGAMSPRESIQEANRWLALVEALLRRPIPRRGPTVLEEVPQQEPLPFDARPAMRFDDHDTDERDRDDGDDKLTA